MPRKSIRVEIERLRRIMHVVARNKGITHPEVLKVSSLLDQKLNEYNRMLLMK
jgi:hypothetical protein